MDSPRFASGLALVGVLCAAWWLVAEPGSVPRGRTTRGSPNAGGPPSRVRHEAPADPAPNAGAAKVIAATDADADSARPGPPLAEAPEATAEPLAPWLREALGLPPGADPGVTLVTNRHTPVAPDRANSADLAVLAEIIATNGLDEASSPFDYDDGDGVFEPGELGLQVWQDGQLVALSLGPDRSSTFGYGLRELPSSVSDLRALRYLDLHANALTGVPSSLGDLSDLRHLYLFRNRLTALPDSLGDLAALEVLIVSGNRLERLPDATGDLSRLVRLQVGENPLDALPDGLRNLASLEVLDLARTRAQGGFENLAALLDALTSLQEVHVTRAEVGAHPPQRLLDGSIPRVYGFAAAGARRGATDGMRR